MAFTLPIGASAPDFNLLGTDGKHYSLASFDSCKILVVAFWCNHCPFVVGSEERVSNFVLEYAPKSVAMIAINSNEQEKHPKDSYEHMVARAKERNFPFHYVRDESQEVATKYGALRTPHFYVFDQQRKLRYTGRFDDNPKNPGQQTTHELKDAVDAVLAGRKPAVEVTNPIGCNVKWKGQDNHWMPPEACDLV
jgi:peroxiredoxin